MYYSYQGAPVQPASLETVPPQEVCDEITLAAQFYAGSLVGHPYRSSRIGAGPFSDSTVEKAHWREPIVLKDDCVFCESMTDEDVLRRVAGFQSQIDLEVLRQKNQYYIDWALHSEEAPEPGKVSAWANRRRFIELRQDIKTEKRPTGWRERPFPLVNLSMRHKRKLCITWNHILLAWMEENELHYDFEKRVFRPNETLEAENVSDSYC